MCYASWKNQIRIVEMVRGPQMLPFNLILEKDHQIKIVQIECY